MSIPIPDISTAERHSCWLLNGETRMDQISRREGRCQLQQTGLARQNTNLLHFGPTHFVYWIWCLPAVGVASISPSVFYCPRECFLVSRIQRAALDISPLPHAHSRQPTEVVCGSLFGLVLSPRYREVFSPSGSDHRARSIVEYGLPIVSEVSS